MRSVDARPPELKTSVSTAMLLDQFCASTARAHESTMSGSRAYSRKNPARMQAMSTRTPAMATSATNWTACPTRPSCAKRRRLESLAASASFVWIMASTSMDTRMCVTRYVSSPTSTTAQTVATSHRCVFRTAVGVMLLL